MSSRSPFLNAGILFRDTFDNIPGSGDVNTETNAVGRQFGTLAPLDYIANPNTIVGESSIFPNQFALTNRRGAGVNYNFMDSKNYTIEFDLLDAPYGGGDWVSFAYGKDVQISGPNSAGNGLGILFRGEAHTSFLTRMSLNLQNHYQQCLFMSLFLFLWKTIQAQNLRFY